MTVRLRTLSTLAAVLATTAIAGSALAADTVKLGYQLPLTGDTAQYGQDFRKAAEIALAEFNAAGKPFKVEIVFEDSRSDAKEGTNIARKFVDDKAIVGVLGDFTSGVSMAAAQVYKEAGLPQLSQTASHPDYAKISKYQFRNIATQAQEGPYNAKWMAAKGFKNIAVIAEQTDWGQSVVGGFSDAVKANGGAVAFSEFFNRGLKDYRSLISKIERAKPDAIYTGFFYEDGAQFLRQLQQLGVKTPVYSTSAAYSPKLIELAGDAAEGVHLTSNFLPTDPAPHIQHFVDEWKARSGGAVPGQFPAQAYDAVRIMLAAVEKASPNPTREKVRDALAQTKDFPGVTGKTTFNADREAEKELVKVEVKGGAFVPVAD
ncbi:branched-chain amino acid transport system substrate-binding protein [Azospirillum agricola]|uniref:ABC transporter substrate-binding protein n=1 Tax=Azospirillum agricola TaxID=1720247 RepID=UPI001AEB84ED|nr:ABC transporter substrate-binding protein [Azospirillum agricola]MBP2231221.1 branched-chain amino acid transport system substrate-binding protein [Azospirillum agricola]